MSAGALVLLPSVLDLVRTGREVMTRRNLHEGRWIVSMSQIWEVKSI